MMLINKDHLHASIWTFIVVVSLLYNSMFGSMAILAFLVAGIVFVSSNFFTSYRYCKKNWILFLIPFWALLSATWSDISIITIRGSVQLIVTTVFAVVIASRLNIDTLLRAIAIAMLLAMLMSLVSSNTAINGLTGEISLIGIFQSKNFLATNTAMSICAALPLSLNKKSDKISRLLGFVLLFISCLVLIKSKSLGAIVFVALTIIATFLIIFYQNLNLYLSTRRKINWLVVMVSLCVISSVFIALVQGTFDEFMYSIGKDPTLTGRTYIWDRGLELIANKPFLGVGFQSLFYIGNVTATDIWEYAHVPEGAGFNFHNMYIDVSVELGFIGLALFLLLIVQFFRKIASLKFIEVGGQQFFSILIFIYLFLQTFLEASWLEQFTIIHLFVCMAWVYLKENKTHES